MVAPARCTCGFTKFAFRIDRTPTVLSYRWRPVPPSGGLGATQLGTAMGSAPQGWGRFALPVHTGVVSTYCLNCLRVRRCKPVGAGIVMASFSDPAAVSVAMTDVVDPSCMTARYEVRGGEPIDMPIEVAAEVPVFPGAPLEVRDRAPSSAEAATHTYRVPTPSTVEQSGVYSLVLTDRCLGTRQLVCELYFAVEVVSVELVSAYGRGGDVSAKAQDYSAAMVLMEPEGVSLEANLNLLNASVQVRAKVQGDLGGLSSAPRVVGLQGRAVQDLDPPDNALLVWSEASQRWEPRSP